MVVNSGDFHIPAEAFNDLVRNRTFLVRPRSAGGPNNAKYNPSGEEKHKLWQEYQRLREELKPLRTDYKYFKKDKRGDWAKLIKDRYGLPEDMIEKLADSDKSKYTPSNLAAELAARRCLTGYENWSLTAEWIKKLMKPIKSAPVQPESNEVHSAK